MLHLRDRGEPRGGKCVEGVFLLNFMRAIISRKAARALNEFARVAQCVRRQKVSTASLEGAENFNQAAGHSSKESVSWAAAGKQNSEYRDEISVF